MVHHVQSSGKLIVKVWLRLIVCHVVEEIDVGETPARVLLRAWPNLDYDTLVIQNMIISKMWMLPKDQPPIHKF